MCTVRTLRAMITNPWQVSDNLDQFGYAVSNSGTSVATTPISSGTRRMKSPMTGNSKPNLRSEAPARIVLKEPRSDFVLCEYETRPDVDLTEWDIQQDA